MNTPAVRAGDARAGLVSPVIDFVKDAARHAYALNYAGAVLSSTTLPGDYHDDPVVGDRLTTRYAYTPQGRLAGTTLPSGLTSVTDYYEGDGSAGDDDVPVGYVKQTVLVKAAAGGGAAHEAVQSFVTYEKHGEARARVWLVKTSRAYEDEVARAAGDTPPSGGIVTSHGYVVQGPHNAFVKQVETKLPAVADEGPGRRALNWMREGAYAVSSASPPTAGRAGPGPMGPRRPEGDGPDQLGVARGGGGARGTRRGRRSGTGARPRGAAGLWPLGRRTAPAVSHGLE